MNKSKMENGRTRTSPRPFRLHFFYDRLSDNDRTIYLPENRVTRLKIDLTAEGGGRVTGFEILDTTTFGMSAPYPGGPDPTGALQDDIEIIY